MVEVLVIAVAKQISDGSATVDSCVVLRLAARDEPVKRPLKRVDAGTQVGRESGRMDCLALRLGQYIVARAHSRSS